MIAIGAHGACNADVSSEQVQPQQLAETDAVQYLHIFSE